MRYLMALLTTLTMSSAALAEDCGMSLFRFPQTICGAEYHWEMVYIVSHTRPGERVMRPEFGVNWDDLCFGPITEEKLTAMEATIFAQIGPNTGIDVKSVDLKQVETDTGLPAFEITVVYYPNGRTQPTDELVVPYRCGN